MMKLSYPFLGSPAFGIGVQGKAFMFFRNTTIAYLKIVFQVLSCSRELRYETDSCCRVAHRQCGSI